MATKHFSKRKVKLRFSDIMLKMENYIDEISKSEFFSANDIKQFPSTPGVYIFYERKRPLYVGRTGNIKRRISQHKNIGSKHNDAPFAYHLAKQKARLSGLLVNDTRQNLCNREDFAEHFINAKMRVEKMKVRFIKIEDDREQSLFEYYASVELHTPWNDYAYS